MIQSGTLYFMWPFLLHLDSALKCTDASCCALVPKDRAQPIALRQSPLLHAQAVRDYSTVVVSTVLNCRLRFVMDTKCHTNIRLDL